MSASARSPATMAINALRILTRSSLRGSGSSSLMASAVPIFSIVRYELLRAVLSAACGPLGRFGCHAACRSSCALVEAHWQAWWGTENRKRMKINDSAFLNSALKNLEGIIFLLISLNL